MALWAFMAAHQRRIEMGRRSLAVLCALLLSALLAPVSAAEPDAAAKSALATIRQAGVLKVALYKDFAPFSNDGKGIDVDLAQALAAKLGVKMTPLWFEAAEKMEDDFRWMVVKGHPLGFGPADVMMHVPVDAEYMKRLTQVEIFAPYHRERFAIARNLEKLPNLDSLDPLEKQPPAVEGDTLAAMVMLSTDNGRYRNTLKIFKTAEEAINALRTGAVDSAIAQQGELEGGLFGLKGFAIELVPQPVLQLKQWALGLAVKAENKDLALALQAAMNEMMADGTVRNIMLRYGVKYRQP